MSNPRLEIRNISRRFDALTAADDVCLSLQQGQVTCLLGPSGCGKSTTLRIVAGVERQDSGQIFVDGALVCDGIRSLPPEQRNIGMMFQDFALFPHLSVWENVAFGLRGAKSARKTRAHDLLERVDLAGYGAHMPHELSGGEQQRVALARAFVTEPEILLADEPTGSLDQGTGEQVMKMLFDLQRQHGTTLILVTHATQLAAHCSRLIKLADGQIVSNNITLTDV